MMPPPAANIGQAPGVKRLAADGPVPPNPGDHDPHTGQSAPTGQPVAPIETRRSPAARTPGSTAHSSYPSRPQVSSSRMGSPALGAPRSSLSRPKLRPAG